MQEHRGAYLAALLTVARGWIVAGRPSKKERGDGFNHWVSGLRGLMRWAGFEGQFGGAESDLVLSSDDQEWKVFLEGLYACYGPATFTTKSIVERLSNKLGGSKLDAECLPGDLAQKLDAAMRSYDHVFTGFSKSLGRWLMNHAGRYADGWKLAPAGQDGHRGKPTYYVKPPAGTKVPPAEPEEAPF